MIIELNACAVQILFNMHTWHKRMFGGVANDIKPSPDFEIVNARDRREMADIERLRLLKAHLSNML